MVKKVKDVKIKTPTVTICYARNGHRLYEGNVNDIPAHILEYYTNYILINKTRKNTYLECTEDNKYWEN